MPEEENSVMLIPPKREKNLLYLGEPRFALRLRAFA